MYIAAMQRAVKTGFINLENVDYILPEETLENSESGVVRPPSPGELKRRAEEDRQKRIADSQALVAGIRQKADVEEND